MNFDVTKCLYFRMLGLFLYKTKLLFLEHSGLKEFCVTCFSPCTKSALYTTLKCVIPIVCVETGKDM